VKVIELLLLAGAEADAEDDLGQRPIDLARGHRRQRVIEYLSRS
jgi:ankyrin repeat protein